MSLWGTIGEGVLNLIPGGNVALAAIKGVQSLAGVIGGETGAKIARGAAMIETGLKEVQPEKMPPELRVEALRERNRHEADMRDAAIRGKRLEFTADRQASTHATERAAQLEGTTRDLLALPVVGRLVIFLRGMQRPVWGFGTLWGDFMVFSGRWNVALQTDGNWTPEGMALILINLLVLGFLFGERAVKNLLPLVTRFLEAWGPGVRRGKG